MDVIQDEITSEQREKLDRMQDILQYHFNDEALLLAAITHPSATEGKSVKYSYERLEFLGDSILGALVAYAAFHEYHDLDEGGLTRIKVALVSGANLSSVASQLGLADVIVFGSSEAGTGRRGLHSALENVYESVVAALYLDGGVDAASAFVTRTLIPLMSKDMASEPENPKSALQEKLQEGGITPTYKLVETQGPPHDRTFVAQVFAGEQALALGTGRTKKEAESQAARSTLARLSEFFGIGIDPATKAEKQVSAARQKAEKQSAAAWEKAHKEIAAATARAEKAESKAQEKARKQAQRNANDKRNG
jgi:ribonuclease III